MRHGMSHTPTYRTWATMKNRCGNRKYWKDVKYDPKWATFEGFLEDMGERPEGTTLDRIDGYGNYTKSNCRWADCEVQQNNRKNNVYYEIDGEALTLPQIARRFNVSRGNLANKIYNLHWDMDTALSYLIGVYHGRTQNVC